MHDASLLADDRPPTKNPMMIRSCPRARLPVCDGETSLGEPSTFGPYSIFDSRLDAMPEPDSFPIVRQGLDCCPCSPPSHEVLSNPDTLPIQPTTLHPRRRRLPCSSPPRPRRGIRRGLRRPRDGRCG